VNLPPATTGTGGRKKILQKEVSREKSDEKK